MSPKNINEMTVQEAVSYYGKIGIFVTPLYGPNETETSRGEKLTSPGKQPVKTQWSVGHRSYTGNSVELNFPEGRNIGYLCGEKPNLTVIDLDWVRPGI